MSAKQEIPDLVLPDAPATEKGLVKAWLEPVTMATYEPAPSEPLPMFFEGRSYQGADGRIYPIPYADRVADAPVAKSWRAAHVENDLVRVMLLPDIGGRIHVAIDKTNGYDFVYRQNVIKPALIGLAGLWCSGGIELNWPQHHRPSTYMPCDVSIERESDGAVTVWMSEHDPLTRMKGMHGVRIRPGSAAVELRVRLHNRTDLPQTFLWWANVATRVHELYQSFFPPDVYYVLDHARRSSSAFPLARGTYYGVDYGKRAREGVPERELPADFVPPPGRYAPNDLSWYSNIPVPTSYMCSPSPHDFFGGYDHGVGAGLVHVADHHISPGKKQWTWGNHAFGYGWDRNLTDKDGPYIELMAGVFTDNQPDFSFIAPGETRTFSQYWYPIQKIGPAQSADARAALSFTVSGGAARVGVCAVERLENVTVELAGPGVEGKVWKRTIVPGSPLVESVSVPTNSDPSAYRVELRDAAGRLMLSHSPLPPDLRDPPPELIAQEPSDPKDVELADELFHIGIHLEQYRQAHRHPDPYWREALRRDPGDVRCNNALGIWHFRRGEYAAAHTLVSKAMQRLTYRNSNPYDGEFHYNLGLCLRALGTHSESVDAFRKSAWDRGWQAPAYFAVALDDCRRGDYAAALNSLEQSLRVNVEDLRARDLKALVLRRLGRSADADQLLEQTLRLDPLDWWARHLLDLPVECDAQTAMDLALEYAAAWQWSDALRALEGAEHRAGLGAEPAVRYLRAHLLRRSGDKAGADREALLAMKASPDHCFPSRPQEMEALESALEANPADARAAYYLGNLFFRLRRRDEAIALWERSAASDPGYYGVWRNLGVAYFNIRNDAAKAREAIDRACALRPDDARLVHGQDQLRKRMGMSPADRATRLEARSEAVARRDDLTLEYCGLLNVLGRFDEVVGIMTSRKFQPWEGGEGDTLVEWVRAQIGAGRSRLLADDLPGARAAFTAALKLPLNLGEDRHFLASSADARYWLAVALERSGDTAAARNQWGLAADFRGDFQDKAICPHSDRTYYTLRSLRALGRDAEADALATEVAEYAAKLCKSRAAPVYFATSLPGSVFNSDLQLEQELLGMFIGAQLAYFRGDRAGAERTLGEVLVKDPSHRLAAGFLREIADEQRLGGGRRGAASTSGSGAALARHNPRPQV